jgi:outer membrane protein assembly factor BamB
MTRNKGRGKISTIPLILLLIIAAFMASLPSGSAQEVLDSFPTHLYLVVNPNPVGVGQSVSVMFWFDNPPPESNAVAYYGWKGIEVTITHPDNTTEKVGPFETEVSGGKWFDYTPAEQGTYKFQASFPGQTVNVTAPWMFLRLAIGLHYFEPSQSSTVELTVQQEAVQPWPEVPLPNEYWERPISSENRDWYSIAGDYLMSESFAEYTQAPESAHILWTKPLTYGGIVGGDSGWGTNYFTAPPYSNRFSPPVIIGGRIYYYMWPAMTLRAQPPGVACVDLRTGEEIWQDDNMPKIVCGQTMTVDMMAGHGVYAYLWCSNGTSLIMYDAFSGKQKSVVENVFGPFSPIRGPNGELLVYSIDGISNRLIMWNSTKALLEPNPATESLANEWGPMPETSWDLGIQSNISISGVPGEIQSLSTVDLSQGVAIAEAPVTSTMNGSNPTFTQIGYDIETGNRIWSQNREGYGWGFFGPYAPGLGVGTVGGGVYTFFQKETMQWHVFDIKTGNKLWSTKPLKEYTNTDYSMYDNNAVIAYGKLYISGYSGCVVAFDLKTGENLWTYSQGSSGVMNPTGSWPNAGGLLIADGKVYIPTSEHTPNSPIFRGYRLICINATTGEQLWAIPGFIGSRGIADGTLVAWNCYDNQIYSFGKGPSATTVMAPSVGVTTATPIRITGTVMDVSAGTEQSAVAKNFPNGLPCVSDASQSAWMEYVYQQQLMPSNATGVKVTLSVLDSNGNFREIGTTTSSPSGVYGFTWTPDVPGDFTLYASFAGSNSYYPSSAETSFHAAEAVAEHAPQNPQPIDNTMTIVYGVIAIIIAIAIVGVVLAMLVLRKR